MSRTEAGGWGGEHLLFVLLGLLSPRHAAALTSKTASSHSPLTQCLAQSITKYQQVNSILDKTKGERRT